MVNEDIVSFKQIIDSLSPKEVDPKTLLPFCHTTTEGAMSDIINSRYVKPLPCKEYNSENILYFFYGKAPYVVNEDLSDNTDDPPVTLIFDAATITQQIKRLLPFDSGGFNRYKMRKNFKKDNFSYCEADYSKLVAFTELLFVDHLQYLQDKVNLEAIEKYEDRCLEMKEILRMYNNAKSLKVGPQIYTIELQYYDRVSFTPTHIVLPYEYFTNRFWQRVMDKYPEINPVSYAEAETIASGGMPLPGYQYQKLMVDKVKNIIQSNAK